ncbi:MAG TPA: YceI family protein [Cyclobacteriaceae bacterium]
MKILNKHKHYLYAILLIGILSKPAYTQTTYQQARDSKLTIDGTSTLHDWSMTSSEGRYNAEFEFSEDGKLIKLNALTFSIRFESLKSGSNALDKNAYSTMETEVHKDIIFKLSKALVNPQNIYCTGNLTIAGTTNLIDLDVVYQLTDRGQIICSGAKKLKMSDYHIDPPVFMFGTVRTGDQISISFNVRLVPANP